MAAVKGVGSLPRWLRPSVDEGRLATFAGRLTLAQVARQREIIETVLHEERVPVRERDGDGGRPTIARLLRLQRCGHAGDEVSGPLHAVQSPAWSRSQLAMTVSAAASSVRVSLL